MSENRFFPKAEGVGLMPRQDRTAWLKGGDARCTMPPRIPRDQAWHLVLLGAPGVGKGTQAELLSERLACCHLSTGDVFRAAKCLNEADQSPALQSAVACMRRGALVPDETVLGLIRDALADGLAPGNVIFEITETAAVSGFERSERFARTLDEMGCHLALDDFGTGFGSFTYLKHLHARYIKIDVEFVRDLLSNDTDQKVVKSIVDIAHSLGKETIAEGVEDAATLAALEARGVDFAQGFYLGRPKRLSPPTLGEPVRVALAGRPGVRARRVRLR